MESILRWGFFLIGAFVIFLIIYDVWFRRRNHLGFKELSLENVIDEPFIKTNAADKSIVRDTVHASTLSNATDESILRDTVHEPTLSNATDESILRDTVHEPTLSHATDESIVCDTVHELTLSNATDESIVRDTVHEPTLSNATHESIVSNTDRNYWDTEEDLLPQIKLPHHVPSVSAFAEDDIIIISVLAKPPEQFTSYDLLQSISATGMQYGAMDIFHYHQPTDQGYITLFSLASATKPGKFDLNHMGDFSCMGLSLFMNKTGVPNPKQAFLIMLEKAQQLADDLNGELRAGPERTPWSDDIVENYLRVIDTVGYPC